MERRSLTVQHLRAAVQVPQDRRRASLGGRELRGDGGMSYLARSDVGGDVGMSDLAGHELRDRGKSDLAARGSLPMGVAELAQQADARAVKLAGAAVIRGRRHDPHRGISRLRMDERFNLYPVMRTAAVSN